jgi:hypothetical protein
MVGPESAPSTSSAKGHTRCIQTGIRTSRWLNCCNAPSDRRVTVSCIVSDLRFEWRLEPSGAGTQITVEVEIPEREAQRLDSQREKISASLTRLAGLAAAS